MKICQRCKISKPTSEFSKNSKKKDGLAIWCKPCYKEYYALNSDKMKTRATLYYFQNKEKVAAYETLEHVKKRRKNYRIEHSLEYIARSNKWHKANKARINEANRKSEKRKLYAKAYFKLRWSNDPLFALKSRIRTLIYVSISRSKYIKPSKTAQILGCTFEELKVHLEKQFVEGMNWENRSLWHIDHIIPVSSAKTEEELIRLNHFSNLQPLWAVDNLAKGARII